MPHINQELACRAYKRVDNRSRNLDTLEKKKYRTFSQHFPALVHKSGLAQAVAFGCAKAGGYEGYMDDLVTVLETDLEGFSNIAHSQDTHEYIHQTRRAIIAANWLKRYAEAVLAEDAS